MTSVKGTPAWNFQEDPEFYLRIFSKLTHEIGISTTLYAIELVRHFYYAPAISITSFLLVLLGDLGVTKDHSNLLLSLASEKMKFGPRTSHEIAALVRSSKSNSSVPSYCLSNKPKSCVSCKQELSP